MKRLFPLALSVILLLSLFNALVILPLLVVISLPAANSVQIVHVSLIRNLHIDLAVSSLHGGGGSVESSDT
jgi:hypothetical protein